MRPVKLLHKLLLGQSIFVILLLCLLERLGCPRMILGIAVLAACGMVVCTIFCVLRPLGHFEEAMEELGHEDCTEERFGNIPDDVPYIGQVKALIDSYAARRTRKHSAEIFDKQTELTALQSQINPHFLYNTLESIRGQALMDDNLEIARMVEAMAAFFRYSISRTGNLVTLRDELANIDNYMMIQRYRFHNRFSMEVIIDEEDEAAYDFLIPRLIIQPIVENAIFHGLEERLEGGKVSIEVIVTERNLIITVSDNGKGIESGELRRLNDRIRSRDIQLEGGEKGRRDTGIALPNIHRRIRLLFGEEYGVNIYSTAGQGTDVEITIPANDKRDMEDEERDTAYQ